MALETKNQFLSPVEGVSVSLKTCCPAWGEKDVDDEENKVSKQERDKQPNSANMGAVSVGYQRFRIRRNVQETKSQHTLAKNASAADSKSLVISSSEERAMFLWFGLTSISEAFSMMGEACYEGTNIT